MTLDWLNSKWMEPFISLRALYQFGPNPIRTSKVAKQVAKTLEEHGWLSRVKQPVFLGSIRQMKHGKLSERRTFYASVLALQVGDGAEDERINKAVSNIERELFAQVSGLEIFAERVGLSLERLLAFSMALENDLVKTYPATVNTE